MTVNTTKDPLHFVQNLRPAALDQLAEEGYARHRHADLARAAAEGHAPGRTGGARPRQWPARPGRHRWGLLTAGVAVAAAAAVAAVIITGGTSGPKPRTSASGAAAVTLDARTFLLASARTASQAPPAAGTYWYVKERDFEPAATIKKQQFGAAYAETEESWTGQSRARTVVNEGVRFSFASKAGAAKWKAAGEPKLATARGASTQPVTSDYRITMRSGVGRVQLSVTGFRNLPTTVSALGALLRKDWNSEPDKAAAVGFRNPTYGVYLIQWAGVLLASPARPGTRAAVFQLLAGQPGVTLTKDVTDPLGRTGVAVSDGAGDYLIINPANARLLATTTYPVKPGTKVPGTGGGTEAIESMSWTNQLG